MGRDLLAAHHRRQAVDQARLVPPPPTVPDGADTLTTATFQQHIQVELCRDGKSTARWLAWVTRWGKRTRRKDFSTPYLDHGRRVACDWYGEAIGGWRAADADAGALRRGPGAAGSASREGPDINVDDPLLTA